VFEALKRVKDFGGRFIDYSMAWKGALFLGIVVWLVNLSHGPLAALPAALKQAAYTYFVAGLITRLCQTLATRIQRRALALTLCVAVPSAIALTLTFGLHTLRGTPEPLHSVIPTLLTAPLAFFWWGRRSRIEQKSEKPGRRLPPSPDH
jgi:hypothetical protein